MRTKAKRVYAVRDTRPPIDWEKVGYWKGGVHWLAANPRTGKVYKKPITRKNYELQVAYWNAWHAAVGRKMARKRWRERCARLRAMGVKLPRNVTAVQVEAIEMELEREKGRAEVGESGAVL